LCNLAAQSAVAAKGSVQAGSGERTDGAGDGTWEIIYFKLYKTQIPVVELAIETAALMLGTDKSLGLLSGDDLCGFSRGGEPGQWEPRGAVAVHLKVLQVPARRTEAGVCSTNRESILNRIPSKSPRLRLDSQSYGRDGKWPEMSIFQVNYA
jgi:hypothetical protein